MKTPLVSVIMPVYNSRDYVKTAVDSILLQTYKNIELICVNDCSSDDSLDVLNAAAASDSRVVVIDSPVNLGAGEARNLGIEKAKGEYITFIDADDTLEADVFEKVTEKICETDADEVVWGLIEEHYDAKDNLIKTVPIVYEESFLTDTNSVIRAILKMEENSLFGYQWNSFYRASVIKENNIRFEKALFYEDFFFNLEFAKHMKNIAVLEYAGYHYFKRVNSSITHRFTKDYFSLSYRRIESMYRFCRDAGYDGDDLYDILGNRLLRYTFSALSRNHNPLSEMSFSDMKDWAEKNTALAMYSVLLPKCPPSNPAHKALKLLIAKKQYAAMVAIGKLVYLVKR